MALENGPMQTFLGFTRALLLPKTVQSTESRLQALETLVTIDVAPPISSRPHKTSVVASVSSSGRIPLGLEGTQIYR